MLTKASFEGDGLSSEWNPSPMDPFEEEVHQFPKEVHLNHSLDQAC